MSDAPRYAKLRDLAKDPDQMVYAKSALRAGEDQTKHLRDEIERLRAALDGISRRGPAQAPESTSFDLSRWGGQEALGYARASFQCGEIARTALGGVEAQGETGVQK